MKKNVYLIFCLICISALLVGCIGEKTDSNLSENTVKLYLMSYTKSYMTKAEKEFNDKFPNKTLDVEYFDNREELANKLNTELLAGRGPDVVLFDSSTFGSIYKTINTGAFCDINTLIKEDKSFNMNSYNEKVMDCGVLNGNRYIIPLDYYLNNFITTEELLKKNNININLDEWDMKRLADILETYIQKNKSDRPEYFFTLLYSFSDYILSSGLNFVDYEKSEANIDTPEFRELLNKYKDVFDKASTNSEVREKYGLKYWEMLKGNTAIAVSEISSIESVWLANSFLHSIFKDKGRLYPLPSYDNSGGYIAKPYNMVAINNNSKNKAIAFDIVKLLLSKDLQMNGSSTFFPVNEEAFDAQIEQYVGKEGQNKSLDIKGSHLNTVAMSKDLVGDLRDIKANLSKCVIVDEYINSLLNNTSEKYIKGEYSEDQVVKEINNKITLYLNE